MNTWILILWATGGIYGLGSNHYADYKSQITTQEMKSKESCIYALEQIKKTAPSIDGYCVPK